jgi:hypothetical protein
MISTYAYFTEVCPSGSVLRTVGEADGFFAKFLPEFRGFLRASGGGAKGINPCIPLLSACLPCTSTVQGLPVGRERRKGEGVFVLA